MNEDELKDAECAMLKQSAVNEDIPWRGKPEVVRQSFDIGLGQRVSALVWRDGEPEVVLLHGRGQNAHTWDTVALALDVPLVAIDLPGHGHSDWREDHDYGAWPNADAVSAVICRAAKNTKVVVGMSLGGLTNIRLAAKYPHLVRRAVIVDNTPASRVARPALTAEQRGATALLDGPSVYNSFEEMLRAAAATVPGRPIESLRTGVLHNSRRLKNGRWTWRYDPQHAEGGGSPGDRSLLWEDLSSVRVPLMLVRSGKSGRVRDDDVDEFLRRQPRARVEFVESAGHSVQSDRPLLLAALIKDFIATTSKPASAPIKVVKDHRQT